MSDAEAESGPLGCVIACGLLPDQLGAYAALFDVYVLAGVPTGGFALQPAPSGPVLQFPPQNVVALVSAGPAQATAAAAWASAAGLEAASVTHGPHMPGLLASLARRTSRSARLAADLALRLAALRNVHENLQNAYEGLRSYVQQGGLALPSLRFVALPDPDGTQLPATAADVQQYIPCDFRSLCGIAVHLAAVPARGSEGSLDVALTSLENAALATTWTVSYRDLRPGWVTFVFDGDAAVVRSGTSLRLRWRTLAAPPPRFSLARPHARQDRGALVDGVQLDRPLAIRAWTRVPGAPLTLTAQLWPAFYPIDAAPPETGTRIEILAGEDFEVEDVRRLNETFDFRPVSKIPRQRRILVHPFGRLPSVARIALACPAGTREIRAEVETDNDKAAALEYGIALAAVPDQQRPGEFDFSGPADWIVVPARTPATLVIELGAPLAEPADLFLVTRCPPGSTSDLAWAHFTRLSVIGDFPPSAA